MYNYACNFFLLLLGCNCSLNWKGSILFQNITITAMIALIYIPKKNINKPPLLYEINRKKMQEIFLKKDVKIKYIVFKISLIQIFYS